MLDRGLRIVRIYLRYNAWLNDRYLGRQKTLYFGAWPEVGIAMARQQKTTGVGDCHCIGHEQASRLIRKWLLGALARQCFRTLGAERI